MIQKSTRAPKYELQIILRLQHQVNVDHDVIVFWYTKCSIISMFILIRDESNILQSLHFDIVFDLWIIFFNSKI